MPIALIVFILSSRTHSSGHSKELSRPIGWLYDYRVSWAVRSKVRVQLLYDKNNTPIDLDLGVKYSNRPIILRGTKASRIPYLPRYEWFRMQVKLGSKKFAIISGVVNYWHFHRIVPPFGEIEGGQLTALKKHGYLFRYSENFSGIKNNQVEYIFLPKLPKRHNISDPMVLDVQLPHISGKLLKEVKHELLSMRVAP